MDQKSSPKPFCVSPLWSTGTQASPGHADVSLDQREPGARFQRPVDDHDFLMA